MLVIRLQGGLGNQMFQYAFGQAIAAKVCGPVYYDDSSFVTDALRDREIDAWQVEIPLVPVAVRHRFPKKFGGLGLGSNLLRGSMPLSRVREKRPYRFDQRYLQERRSAYYDGFWQNQSYFEAVADKLREKFQPRQPLGNHSTKLLSQIEKNHSVNVHIRRGDYVNHPVHYVCDMTYYEQAVSQLLSKYTGLHLFVFSDDPEWCEKNLDFPCPMTIVDSRRGAPPHEDIFLMQHCRHHVIPNSSFSWWGAWLKHDSSGEVYAPDRWFADESFGGDAIAPSHWQRICTQSATSQPIERAA